MDEHGNVKDTKLCFNYHTNETKYYLLTEGSGYPLAEFISPIISHQSGAGLVIPENRLKTADLAPGADVSQ